MRFDSKSVLLNDGVNMKVMIDIPEVFDHLDFPECIWNTAISEFNRKLNERATVTQEVLGTQIDILQLERGDSSIKLAICVKKDEVEAFEDVWFKLSGQIVFKDHTTKEVEEVLIRDLTYKDASGTVLGVLNKNLTS